MGKEEQKHMIVVTTIEVNISVIYEKRNYKIKIYTPQTWKATEINKTLKELVEIKIQTEIKSTKED